MQSRFILIFLLFAACRPNPTQHTETQENTQKSLPVILAPDFNVDSAYSYIDTQVGFGFRIPNTASHDKCADWLISKLKQYTGHVEIQQGQVTAYDGTRLNIKNIMAEFNPDRRLAILLISHWDSRPWADQDSVEMKKPIQAASDGARGGGVILEIGRQVSLKAPEVCVKVLLVDEIGRAH